MPDLPIVLAFVDLLNISSLPEGLRLVLQIITLGASLALLFFMVQYEKRNFLDTSLLLRELAFAILFVRLSVLNAFGITHTTVTNLTYFFMAVACVLVLIAVIRTRTLMFLDSHEKRKKLQTINRENENGNEKI